MPGALSSDSRSASTGLKQPAFLPQFFLLIVAPTTAVESYRFKTRFYFTQRARSSGSNHTRSSPRRSRGRCRRRRSPFGSTPLHRRRNRQARLRSPIRGGEPPQHHLPVPMPMPTPTPLLRPPPPHLERKPRGWRQAVRLLKSCEEEEEAAAAVVAGKSQPLRWWPLPGEGSTWHGRLRGQLLTCALERSALTLERWCCADRRVRPPRRAASKTLPTKQKQKTSPPSAAARPWLHG
mmetsp:Transcript_25901/g.52005  ORF Transcript_25901/g.52005 Transcript_25901/m.52005 type:complete len:236 (-) Transcript_25901:219-926(-)